MSRSNLSFLTTSPIAAIALCIAPMNLFSDSFVQTNLVSDVPGLAITTDPNLRNPWGVSFGATSPFWVSDQVTGVASLYGGNGSTIVPLVVGVPGGPTGQVFNSTTDFIEGNGTKASFIFATLGGSIYAWNGTPLSPAQLEATTKGGSFTGLALANSGGANYLYAANGAGGGSINVFDSAFLPKTLTGSFTDPGLPAGYVPYNIQAINGELYVEYANLGTGKGAVDIFNTNGTLNEELISPGSAAAAHLDDPWGVVIAPAGFGQFSGDLLVGNLANGWINVFDPTKQNTYLGTLDGLNGLPLANDGLWSLSTRTGGGFDTNAVYFTAGINGQTDGLFGRIDAVPEPMSIGFVTLGCVAVGLIARRKRIHTK